METNNTYSLTPKIRFPEFKDDGEWEEDYFGNRGEFIGGGTPSRNISTFWTGEIPWISSSDISEDSITRIEISRYISNNALKESATKLIPKGSVLLISRVGVGKLAISQIELCTSQDYTNFLPKFDQPYFIGYYLKANIPKLTSLCQGMAIKGFTKEDISSLRLCFPIFQEQQKIAACLSSIDNLIESENKKLDSLKEHKKGLLQQLFPAEGENVPKVRFPEFKDDGEWEISKLGKIGPPSMCKRILKGQTTKESKNSIPFYKIGTFGRDPDSFISSTLFKEYKSKYSYPKYGDILISASGTIGRLVVFNGQDAYFQDSNIVWIANDTNIVENSFLFFIYQKVEWKTSDGGIINRLYNSDLASILIQYPINKNEQQKIASCLSSIDNLIELRTSKIESLKEHKKGLMQQLFPSNI